MAVVPQPPEQVEVRVAQDCDSALDSLVDGNGPSILTKEEAREIVHQISRGRYKDCYGAYGPQGGDHHDINGDSLTDLFFSVSIVSGTAGAVYLQRNDQTYQRIGEFVIDGFYNVCPEAEGSALVYLYRRGYVYPGDRVKGRTSVDEAFVFRFSFDGIDTLQHHAFRIVPREHAPAELLRRAASHERLSQRGRPGCYHVSDYERFPHFASVETRQDSATSTFVFDIPSDADSAAIRIPVRFPSPTRWRLADKAGVVRWKGYAYLQRDTVLVMRSGRIGGDDWTLTVSPSRPQGGMEKVPVVAWWRDVVPQSRFPLFPDSEPVPAPH